MYWTSTTPGEEMVKASKGIMEKTRQKFRRGPRERGLSPITRSFQSFEVGARVTIAGRTKERLEAALPEIRGEAREGGDADSFAADVRDPEQVEKLLAHAISRFGVVDGLVNNAAGNFLVAAEDLTPNGFDAVVRTVLHGSVFCTLAVGRHLFARKAPGAIVSITCMWSAC